MFLAGLLAGGLLVAWLVTEPSPEAARGLPVAEAPATPVAAGATPVVLAPPQVEPSQDHDIRGTPEELPDEIPDVALVEPAQVASDESPGPLPVQDAVPLPVPPVQDTPLLPALHIPVEGILASELVDSFSDARGDDRVHDALDIMATEGTPVLAAADGPIVKLFDSVAGGTTLYQFDEAGQVAFYYAHLQRYAEGIDEGTRLRQGEVLGYVGHTGNANAAAPHLHFAIFVLGPEQRWWEGEAINPYPLLVNPPR